MDLYGYETGFDMFSIMFFIVFALIVGTNSHTDSSGVHHGSSSHTSYYVTFEFESKDRTEFCVNGKEYGMIAEGDYGKLKFQGTRFLEFNRI